MSPKVDFPGISLFRLDGQTAIVTGGSKGLGLAMAAGLASAGAKIMLVSRNENEAIESAAAIAEHYEVDAFGMSVDVTDSAATNRMVEAATVRWDKVDILIAQGRMKEAGYKSIALAKENGSWTYLDEVEALIVPEDLQEALAKHEDASEYFDSLSKSNKKILLYWVLSAKRKETRQKRILEIAENAGQQLKPKQFR